MVAYGVQEVRGKVVGAGRRQGQPGVVAEGEDEGMVAEMEEMKAQVREGRGWRWRGRGGREEAADRRQGQPGGGWPRERTRA